MLPMLIEVTCLFALFAIQSAAQESAPDTVYLLPGLYSGLTNQRFSFYHAVLLAVERKWILALPSWKLGYNDYVDGKTLPFGYFYSFDDKKLANSTYFQDFKYATDLPQDRLAPCLTQLQCTSFNDCKYPSLAIMDGRAKAQRVVCLDSDSTYYTVLKIAQQMYKSDSLYDLPILYELRNAMVVRPMFTDIARLILRRMDRTFGTKGFISVHLRIEQDFQTLCNKSQREQWQGSATLACSEGEDAVYESLVGENIPFGSILMIMNGVQTEYFSALPRLCGTGECRISSRNTSDEDVVRLHEHCLSFICVRKENFWGVNEASPEFFRHEMSLSMVDFALAAEASLFLGNMYSTMSKELFYAFVGANRKAVMYNRPCNSFHGKCP